MQQYSSGGLPAETSVNQFNGVLRNDGDDEAASADENNEVDAASPGPGVGWTSASEIASMPEAGKPAEPCERLGGRIEKRNTGGVVIGMIDADSAQETITISGLNDHELCTQSHLRHRAGEPQEPKGSSIAQDAANGQKAQQSFFLRFKPGFFGVSVGFASNSLVWKFLSEPRYGGVTPVVSSTLWWLALGVLLVSLVIFTIRLARFPDAALREICDPVRCNFYFMPMIATSLLLLATPELLYSDLGIQVIFYTESVIDWAMRILLWSEWLVSKNLSIRRVYSPGMLTLINLFLQAKIALTPAINSPQYALALSTVGVVFYFTVFAQSFGESLGEKIPLNLLPSLFFYLAPPFAASVVWPNLPISGSLDTPVDETMGGFFFYFALFLYALMTRFVSSFMYLPFSLTWWAYTFPTAAGSIAALHWADKSRQRLGFAYFLCAVSNLVFLCVLVIMVAKVLRAQTLFPMMPDDPMMDFVRDIEKNESSYVAWRDKRVQNPEPGIKKRTDFSSMSIADCYVKISRWRYWEEISSSRVAHVDHDQ